MISSPPNILRKEPMSKILLFTSVVAVLLLGQDVAHSAERDIKRLVETGPSPQAVCESLTKKSLLGYENAPQKIKPGTCTCSPNNVKGSPDGVECVFYFTTGN